MALGSLKRVRPSGSCTFKQQTWKLSEDGRDGDCHGGADDDGCEGLVFSEDKNCSAGRSPEDAACVLLLLLSILPNLGLLRAPELGSRNPRSLQTRMPS